MAGITSLRERRIEACDSFALPCAGKERFGHRFPKMPVASLTWSAVREENEEFYARYDYIPHPFTIRKGIMES